MRIRKPLLFCGMLLVICSTKAQNINPTEFVDFFPDKLKKISAKIHLAIVKNQISSYASDSLERKDLLKIKYNDTFSMSEYGFRNKSEELVPKLKLDVDPSEATVYEYEDMVYFRFIDVDDYTPNISLVYNREIGKLGEIKMKISAVGITTDKDYYIGDSVVKYQLVAGYVKFTDLNKILSVDDIKFLQLYSWYNSTGEPNLKYRDNYEVVILILNGNNKNNYTTSSTNRMGENLGKYISYSIKDKLFVLYRNKMFEIISGDTTVSFGEFEMQNSLLENVQFLAPGIDPNSDHDPTDYFDSTLLIKPHEFDFLGFEKRNNQIYFEIFKKNPILIFGETSEPKYIRTKYKIPFTAVVKYLHPTEIEAIQYLFK